MPNWLIFALAAYFLAAITAVIDKIILIRTILRPIFYAGLVGLSGIYVVLLMPFGFNSEALLQNPDLVLLGLASGMAFVFSLYFLYSAVIGNEVSRIGPLIGSLTPIFTLIFGFWLGVEQLDNIQLFSFFLLLLGGVLISIRIGGSASINLKSFLLSAIASVLLALSFVLIKIVYSEINFLTGYIVGRFGEFFAGVLLFLLAKKFNGFQFKDFWQGLSKKAIGLFALNKAIAGTFFILLNYAVFLGSVSLIQAMAGVQQVFLLIFATFLASRFPSLISEKISWKTILVKAIAILVIASGLLALAFSQKPANLAPGLKNFGVTFSKPWAKELGLNWRETFQKILDDLGIKKIRLPAYWTEIEPASGKMDFADLDWQIAEAEKRGVKIILAVGQRLPRWPECHIPEWAKELSVSEQQQKLLSVLGLIINRYKNSSAIEYWQIENEPFFSSFGICPELDKKFFSKEIALVKSLDNRPIIVSASGELDPWFSAAKRADVLGTTMYRIVYNSKLGYVRYPLPPSFFHLKANLVKIFSGTKKIIVTELQAEPWGPQAIYEMTLEERDKSLNFEQFKKNIEYARQVGFSDAYLWGVEWWYWEKLNGRPEFWKEAQKLF